MTIVNLKSTSLDEGVKNMMNGAKADYVSWTTDKNGNVSDYSKEEIANWDNKTRVACVIAWPIAAVVFIFSLIKSYFK